MASDGHAHRPAYTRRLNSLDVMDHTSLAEGLPDQIRSWGRALGFQQVGITDARLDLDEARLQRWLQLGRHGTMAYMEKHGTKRSRPGELVAGTISVISARMNYLGEDNAQALASLQRPDIGYVSRYALGRDYHKVLRRRLQALATHMETAVGAFGYRVFTDSAPVLERGLARKAGLGWFGKHANLLNREHGSWFFLGEIYTDLAIPPDPPYETEHCGRCVACIDACPTGAIVAPYEVDARRCISYLTIENRGAIPIEFRSSIGNRIFGCDDCQLVCPWNRFAVRTEEQDFAPRHGLAAQDLVTLFNWSAADFSRFTEGSALRRVGYPGWLRNTAVALGNSPASELALAALRRRLSAVDPMVAEHINWAIKAQEQKRTTR